MGACTDCRGFWAQYRAGALSEAELGEVQLELCATAGTCMVMGTASTMACLTEVLGLMVPGGATPPATSSARLRHAAAAGRVVVVGTLAGRRPSTILTTGSFRNAVTCLLALGGSTNAVIHLIARPVGRESS